METNKKKQAGKRYDEVFGTEAVKLLMRAGARLKAIAADLGDYPCDAAGLEGPDGGQRAGPRRIEARGPGPGARGA